ncbi:MAG: hypothetical protein IJX99_05860 [Clostridia bacterium]|nr:hypothetical protein [Clostridia bacterium]
MEDVLKDEKFMEGLSEVLEKDNVSLKVSTANDELKIEEIKIESRTTQVGDKNNKDPSQEKEKNENKFFKLLGSVGRIFEEFFDSAMRKFLKKKFKLNYSVYNDGKKAIIAAREKDAKTFWQKATDSILYAFKKIPAETKKIIKNTKNVAIDEIFSWKKE